MDIATFLNSIQGVELLQVHTADPSPLLLLLVAAVGCVIILGEAIVSACAQIISAPFHVTLIAVLVLLIGGIGFTFCLWSSALDNSQTFEVKISEDADAKMLSEYFDIQSENGGYTYILIPRNNTSQHSTAAWWI